MGSLDDALDAERYVAPSEVALCESASARVLSLQALEPCVHLPCAPQPVQRLLDVIRSRSDTEDDSIVADLVAQIDRLLNERVRVVTLPQHTL